MPLTSKPLRWLSCLVKPKTLAVLAFAGACALLQAPAISQRSADSALSKIPADSALSISTVDIGLSQSPASSALSQSPADRALSPADVALGFELIKSKTCLGCHQIDTKRVGPAFEQIAQRHGDTKGAVDYLAGAIRQGGRGRWGAVPMPAQPHVTEVESQQIAQWILSLKH